ncbi:MAG: AAA family ATPase [Proteobacteria bacterium]|nr:AAA family ATPase [Pseudomonadota bacterium]
MNPFLNNLIGHSDTVKQFQTAISKGTLPHAIIFVGSEGIGKRTLAAAIATEIFLQGENSETTKHKINLLKAGNYPDLHFLYKEEGKKDITADSVRDLIEKLQLKPYYTNSAVAIIDNAHEMNITACNILLKTLEEPHNNSYLFLITHLPQRLPATILSRCQTVYLSDLKESEIEKIVSLKFSLKENNTKVLELVKILAKHSLSPLKLEQFVNPHTLNITNPEGLLKHLNEQFEEIGNLGKQLNKFFISSLKGESSAKEAVCLGSELNTKFDDPDIVWQISNNILSNLLKSDTCNKKEKVAKLLDAAIHSQKMTKERNLNFTLQITDLLLKAV